MPMRCKTKSVPNNHVPQSTILPTKKPKDDEAFNKYDSYFIERRINCADRAAKHVFIAAESQIQGGSETKKDNPRAWFHGWIKSQAFRVGIESFQTTSLRPEGRFLLGATSAADGSADRFRFSVIVLIVVGPHQVGEGTGKERPVGGY